MANHDFKVGDRVRLLTDFSNDEDSGAKKGAKGTIVAINDEVTFPIRAHIDGQDNAPLSVFAGIGGEIALGGYLFLPEELERV